MTKHLAELKKDFLTLRYQETTIDFQFNCLKENIQTETKGESIHTSLVLTNNQNLPNFRKNCRGQLEFPKI